jgi:hypothetical protein
MVTVPREVARRLRHAAAEEEVPVAELVRRLILERYGGEQEQDQGANLTEK